jgi:hypothetical protein
VSEDRTRDLRIMRPTRYQLRYRRHGVKEKTAPGSDACETACETGPTKSRSQPVKRPGLRVDRHLWSSGRDASPIRRRSTVDGQASTPQSLPPRVRRASERGASNLASTSAARAVGCFAQWHDSRLGRERSRAQFPEQPYANESSQVALKVEARGGPLVAKDDPQLAAWSSGVILAWGARGPGRSSRRVP